jgi:hypothetical protein
MGPALPADDFGVTVRHGHAGSVPCSAATVVSEIGMVSGWFGAATAPQPASTTKWWWAVPWLARCRGVTGLSHQRRYVRLASRRCRHAPHTVSLPTHPPSQNHRLGRHVLLVARREQVGPAARTHHRRGAIDTVSWGEGSAASSLIPGSILEYASRSLHLAEVGDDRAGNEDVPVR